VYQFLITLAIAGLFLQGCASVPLTSLPRLGRINFMTTDLSRLRVATALPMALAPKADGVVMDVTLHIGTAPEKVEHLMLLRAQSVADRQGLPTDVTHEQAIYVFQLSSPDVEKLNALRREVIEAQQRREKGSLGLGISAKQFCKLSALPDGPALITTYIMTTENESYVPVTRNFDLRSDSAVASGLEKLELCR
jgi:hypothetical protein